VLAIAIDPRRYPAWGFTLIELLVVVAIIAILASMLFPALARSKAGARRIACVNHLKQLAQATVMYAGDNDGCYPRSNAPANGPRPFGRAVTTCACSSARTTHRRLARRRTTHPPTWLRAAS
jgi:prepilin-type N-terminal cleavage/methylation domain-containing protein